MKIFSGIVRKHKGRGKTLGFPTANIDVNEDAAEGVFVGYTRIHGELLPSLIFIGAPKTFSETKKRLEAHILDFDDGDLYGKRIEVKILEKIRDNRKFDSEKKLIEQMERDKLAARHFFKYN
jgi:riboflavin kinase/FMN adenylyltransferase